MLQIWAYEAFRIFHDRLVDKDARKQFTSIINGILQDEWRSGGVLAKLNDFFYVSWVNSAGGARLPPFGKTLEGVKPNFIEDCLVKAINRFSEFKLNFLNFLKKFKVVILNLNKKMPKTTRLELFRLKNSLRM